MDLTGIHVLLVEDTDDSRELLRTALESCGALVTEAPSAEVARKLLQAVRPHVLVTDISMPGDGLNLIREVRAIAEAQGIRVPAIAITAGRGLREKLLAEGFAELVEKPLDPIALCGTIRRHAEAQSSG